MYPRAPHIEAAQYLRLTVNRYLNDRASLTDIEEAMTLLRASVPDRAPKESK